MNILHLIPYFIRATKTGGPAMQLLRLASAEKALGNQVMVVATTGNVEKEISLSFEGDFLETLEHEIPTIYLRRKTGYIPHSYYYAPYLATWLKQNLNSFDIVIVHGTWTHFSRIGTQICQRMAKPYLFFIHGSLDPWAFNYRRWKKLPYWYLIEKPNFHKASGVIVLNQDEKAQLRALGINKKCYHIRNGLLFPLKKMDNPDAVLTNFLPDLKGHPFVFSMSRLHPKKGLDMLLEAWGHLIDKHPDWRLVIAGPDEGEYLSKLKNIVRCLDIGNSVEFPGLVTGDIKTALLQKASIFVLPSFSEGVPGAVVDALAYGVPVVITPGCHLPEVEIAEAGMIVEPNPEAVAIGLDHLITNVSLRQQMKHNGMRLARSDFDEMQVAAGFVEFLEDTLHHH